MRRVAPAKSDVWRISVCSTLMRCLAQHPTTISYFVFSRRHVTSVITHAKPHTSRSFHATDPADELCPQ
ncbi:hypothetical protein LSTR_LSTR012963 [Laodelphax striatellus]|uniref:Uncharacterized protein n=1 Tax=Laodelphax striatellus TaxID=195883 RepID=A0A482XJU7_LAOST|nr:hypothetical protein LSTR_LSTR012963 [Laodelphax striatellus]